MGKQLFRFFYKLRKKQKKWVVVSVAPLVIGMAFFLAAFSNVLTETYDIARFSTAQETIRSPITIENKQETERAKREAVQSVEDRYSVSSEIVTERVTYINELFGALEKLDAQMNTTDKDELTARQDKKEKLQTLLSPPLAEALNPGIMQPLIDASESERALGKELVITSIYDSMNTGVRIEDVTVARKDSRQTIRYSSLNAELKATLKAVSDFAIVENAFIDPEKTLEARKQAAGNIEPVMIRAGEVVVQKGQTITGEVYDELKLLGLLDRDRNFYPLIGLALYSLLISALIGFFLNYIYREKRVVLAEVAAVTFISLLMITVMKAVSLFMTPVDAYYLMVPAAAGAMLLKILLNERFALMMAAVYALMGGLLFNAEITGSMNMEAAIYFFLSQVAGIAFLSNLKDRLVILKVGLGITAVHLTTVLVFLFFSFETYSLTELLWQSAFAVLSVFLSSVLTIGLLPFFEMGLNILSDTKLLTLSNPNHPLLRKILMEAPGTYHHSLMVANLSEAACEAVGANGLLARVAAYYHDVGKTVNPLYFIENQMGRQNPHDKMSPHQSAEIIIRHPYDGADLLRSFKLPQEIVDIAEQHHGNTLLKYFYFKEKEEGASVKEDHFRYPGPIPQTKEAAIVCICDSVEAAVRSMKEPDKEKVSKVVTTIVNDKTNDGQFNATPLTFKELGAIQTAICESLGGVFHSRIEYPDDKEDQQVKEAN